ncbi:MAG: sugar ABC transporter substrate-binding protein [Candidatus Leucobacter sulfamidivorax]|nr:sugar ABC transporter substrate-binding protein [Candidatus Leucobacter sulfamidivorax]
MAAATRIIRARSAQRKVVGAVALGAALALALSACASDSGEGAGDDAGTGGASEAVIAEARAWVQEASQPPSWPVPETPIANPADLAGKTVMLIPFSDQIPIMHGTAMGMQEALAELGAEGVICDGGANPSQMATCLKTAGDQQVAAAVTLFMEYDPLANAIDATIAAGVPVLVAGVAPSAARPAGDGLAYGDNTQAINTGYENVARQAIAAQGADTNILWARLMDSSLTTGFSDAGIAKFEELCPDCGVATVDFTTSSLDKLPTAISAALASNPNTTVVFIPPDAYLPAGLPGIQSAGFIDRVKIVGNAADPAGLQRVAAGTQASTAASSVLYDGWEMTHALMLFLSGEDVPPFTVDASRVFTPEVVAEIGEIRPEDYFGPAWFGEPSYKDDFLAVWGVE